MLPEMLVFSWGLPMDGGGGGGVAQCSAREQVDVSAMRCFTARQRGGGIMLEMHVAPRVRCCLWVWETGALEDHAPGRSI